MELKFGLAPECHKVVKEYRGRVSDVSQVTQKQMNLYALRNQTAAFQLMMQSDKDFILCISSSASFDKDGIIDNVRVETRLREGDLSIIPEMYIEGFVEDDDRCLKADILLNDESIKVCRKSIQPVWIDLNVPANTKPGKYNGAVDVYHSYGFKNERKLTSLHFLIEVLDITLPRPNNYIFYLDLWQHNSNIARKHELRLWSNEHFSVMEQYIKSLSQLGQKAVTVVVSEIPWSGQFCYRDEIYRSDLYEYSMVKVKKNTAGELLLDFTVLDRYILLCFTNGINQEIEIFGLLNIWMNDQEGFGKISNDMPDAMRIRFKDETDGCFKYIDNVEDLSIYIKKLENHFIDMGYIDKTRVVADEPSDILLFRKRLTFLKTTAPYFKYKAAINNIEFIEEFTADIDDFVPKLDFVIKNSDMLESVRSKIKGKMYWYVCCEPKFPNTYISSHLLESYVLGLLTQYTGMDGFLRWNYTVWPEKPRDRISFRSPWWAAGDTNFVYPSSSGRPLLTLRYKALQRGIQLFEMIEILKEKNPNSKRIINEVFKRMVKIKNINCIDLEGRLKPEEQISVDYEDYQQSLLILAEGISSTVRINKSS